MSFLAPLDVSDPGVGGKARSLARLAALGFATPAGFVVKDDLFRALCPHRPKLAQLDEGAIRDLKRIGRDIDQASWPGGFREELKSRLRAIDGNRFAVRSSFASEDEAGALAAGVYESCVDVALDDVEKAIKRVLRSAMSPGAAAYAMANGGDPGQPPVAVLVHAFVAGEAEGSAALASGNTPVLMVRRGLLPEATRAELEAGLLRLAQDFGSVEVEWVLSARGLVYLQARPFRPKAPAVEWPGWKDLPSTAGDRESWHWDAAHNPLPLSPAQAGLVELVDERCQIGIRQRVLGGYLFYAKDGRRPPHEIRTEDAAGYFAELQGEVDTRLVALGPEPRLDDALGFFVDVYQRIFGVLQPALKRARQALHTSVSAHAQEGLALLPALVAAVPSMATERRLRAQAIGQAKSEAEKADARAAYLARFGDEAPVWDVCAPTYAEDASPLSLTEQAAVKPAVDMETLGGFPYPRPLPAALQPARFARPRAFGLRQAKPGFAIATTMDWQVASLAMQAMMTEAERKSWHEVLSAAREAIALSEADDWLYARVQAAVRGALLARGKSLQRTGRLPDAEDVFFLPLRLVWASDGDSSSREALAELAQAGRVAWQAAHKRPPPTPGLEGQLAVRGHGTGGHALGRIAVHRSGSFQSTTADAVLLAQTLLPTELPLISARAIVTETGGPLDHVAAQARERKIPAVIGATGARAILHEGDLVLVDGERGLVVRLGRQDL